MNPINGRLDVMLSGSSTSVTFSFSNGVAFSVDLFQSWRLSYSAFLCVRFLVYMTYCWFVLIIAYRQYLYLYSNKITGTRGVAQRQTQLLYCKRDNINYISMEDQLRLASSPRVRSKVFRNVRMIVGLFRRLCPHITSTQCRSSLYKWSSFEHGVKQQSYK